MIFSQSYYYKDWMWLLLVVIFYLLCLIIKQDMKVND